MSEVNPKNIQGATTTLIGRVSKDATTPAYDKEGTSGVIEVTIPHDEGYMKDGEFNKTGTTWYTYSAFGEYANALKGIKKGDRVRVDNAKQEVRAYKNKDGAEVLAINLRFGSITVLASQNSAVEEPF